MITTLLKLLITTSTAYISNRNLLFKFKKEANMYDGNDMHNLLSVRHVLATIKNVPNTRGLWNTPFRTKYLQKNVSVASLSTVDHVETWCPRTWSLNCN